MQTPTPETHVSIRCQNCAAKIRAPRKLSGRTCPCPQCRQPITVRAPLPSDADIALVFEGQSR